jgi:hypothetical protein
LLVVYYPGHYRERLPSVNGGEGRVFEFDGAMIAIWSLLDSIGSPVTVLAPPEVNGERLHRFDVLAAVSRPGGLPSLIYRAYFGGMLQPVDGRYIPSKNFDVRPAIVCAGSKAGAAACP